MSAAELQRVLLVEDDPDIQVIARFSLETLGGIAVQVCGSGQEGLAAARDWQPDLIALDVMMPGMDGPTTLAQLRKAPKTAHIPVVFVTARVQNQDLAAYLAMGAVGVISKPFDPVGLPGQLRGLWTAWKQGKA